MASKTTPIVERGNEMATLDEWAAKMVAGYRCNTCGGRDLLGLYAKQIFLYGGWQHAMLNQTFAVPFGTVLGNRSAEESTLAAWGCQRCHRDSVTKEMNWQFFV